MPSTRSIMYSVRSKYAFGTDSQTNLRKRWPSRRKKNAKNGASSIAGSQAATPSSAPVRCSCR